MSTTIESKPVTAENLVAALLAWDAWERAAIAAAEASRKPASIPEIEAAWSEVERLHAVAKSYEQPRATLRREGNTAEERVIRGALLGARFHAEEAVRVNTSDIR